MKDPEAQVRVGLCIVCRWAREVRNRRGSRFYFCRKALEDPGFPRYPKLPVLECSGFQGKDEADEAGDQDEPAPART